MCKNAHAKDGAHDLAMFACPNPDCDRFNQFNAGNLGVAERMGKDKSIRRLYCNHCQHRFSERQGSLMQYTKLPEQVVVRMLKRAGQRADDFHDQQLERLEEPIEAVELDELHGRVCKNASKKGGLARSRMGGGVLDAVADWVETGFTRLWRSSRGS